MAKAILEVDTIESMGKYIEALQQENERLDYTLIGVMYFVDKWLDDTDGMNEVNRAAKAREVALHVIETLEQENEQLRAQVARVREALRKARNLLQRYKDHRREGRCLRG